MTTIAVGYAMAQFFENGEIVGKSLPLQVAAAMAENLVSVQTGTPSFVMQTSPNADETDAWRSLGTLSNILAACIRSPHAGCGPLFTLSAAANGPKPTTTLQAVLGIARRPTTNVRQLFALGSPETGYTLPSAGAPVRLANGELLYEPLAPSSFKPLMRATAAHVDMAGNVWITNNWKPSGLNDVALNPGGDGIVIFVGLAAPVKPTIAGHPQAP